jgi:hypothetical protein
LSCIRLSAGGHDGREGLGWRVAGATHDGGDYDDESLLMMAMMKRVEDLGIIF